MKLSGWKILRVMFKHIWPRDQPKLKARVVVALGFLVGAKVGYFYRDTITARIATASPVEWNGMNFSGMEWIEFQWNGMKFS